MRSRRCSDASSRPRVLVDPGELDEVPTYYGSSDATEIPDVLVLDEKLTPLTHPVSRARQSDAKDNDCRLPRSIAENTTDHSALVTCVGSNMLVEYALESPASGARVVPRRHWPVAAGPTGVAYDPRAHDAVVWSQFDHVIALIALPAGSIEDRLIPEKDRITRWTLARPASIDRDGETEAGRELFHSLADARLSREGLACASCHPDGRDDALTWATSDGPRQTPMLAGRLLGTEPYAWSGTSERVSEHLDHTLSRLGGSGLKEREMKAIASYCENMRQVSSVAKAQAKSNDENHKGHAESEASDAQVARGKVLFNGTAGCASCHAPAKDAFTDHKKHDVGSQTLTDTDKSFDTPSLRFVGGTAPYFHDGRYATLRDVLLATDTKMGTAASLSAPDQDALIAYLKTL